MRFADAVRHSALGPLSSLWDTVLTSRTLSGPAPSAGADERTRWRPSSHLRVLLVEDCPVIQMLTRMQLARWGIAPKIAVTLAEWRSAVARHRLDIVLWGIEWPHAGELALTISPPDDVRRRGAPSQIPLIAYGASVRGPLPRKLRQMGFDAGLRKPCNDDEMRACLFQWCAHCFIPQGLSEAQVRLARAQQR